MAVTSSPERNPLKRATIAPEPFVARIASENNNNDGDDDDNKNNMALALAQRVARPEDLSQFSCLENSSQATC